MKNKIKPVNTLFNGMLMPSFFILLWSSGYIFVEKGLQDNGPLVFLTLRFVLAWLTLLIICLYQRSLLPKSGKQLVQICSAGIFLQVFYLGFFFIALDQHMPAGILAIILGAQPIVIALLFRESLSLTQKLGLFLGLLGLALTVSDSLFTGSITSLGFIAAFLSLAGITFGTILQKKYCIDIPLSTNMMLQFFISALILSILYFTFGATSVNWTVNFVIALFWVTFVMSVGAFFLFYALLKKGKAASVTSLLYGVPPVTAAVDYLVLHHVLPVLSLIGMAIVVVSLVLIHRKDTGHIVILKNQSSLDNI